MNLDTPDFLFLSFPQKNQVHRMQSHIRGSFEPEGVECPGKNFNNDRHKAKAPESLAGEIPGALYSYRRSAKQPNA